VDKVHIFFWESAVVEHSNILFKNHTATHVRFDSRSVSHIEGSHELEHGDFDREVERTDDTDGTERPSETLSHLSSVISGVGETSGKETNLITAEVFKEIGSN
jgi:hypothetical protein